MRLYSLYVSGLQLLQCSPILDPQRWRWPEILEMEQEAVSEGQKQDKIAPGFFVSTLQKTARGQKEGRTSDSCSAVSGMGTLRG